MSEHAHLGAEGLHAACSVHTQTRHSAARALVHERGCLLDSFCRSRIDPSMWFVYDKSPITFPLCAFVSLI